MAVLPDDIRDMQGMDVQSQLNTVVSYIKYMKEQIEFWASNRVKEMTETSKQITNIKDALGYIGEWMDDKDIHTATISNATSNGYGYINTDLYLKDGQIVLGVSTSTAADADILLMPVLWPNAGGSSIYGRWLIACFDNTMTPLPNESVGSLTIYYTNM